MSKPKADAENKTDLWMPLWIGDYLADTMRLPRDLHGGYLLLLFAYWRARGPLPNDQEDLLSVMKGHPPEWDRLRTKILEAFFTLDNGCWRHKRADAELVKAGLNKAVAVARARKAAAARWDRENSSPPARQDGPNGSSGTGSDDAPGNALSNAPSSASSNAPCSAPGNAQAMLGECSSPSPSPNPAGSSSVAKATVGLAPDFPSHSVPPAKPPVRDVAAALLPPPGVPVPPAPPPGVTGADPGVLAAEDDDRNLTPAEKRKRAAWRAGKSILNAQGMPMAQTGTFLGALARKYGEEVFLASLEAAVVKRPADVAEWITASCQTGAGERQAKGGKQSQLESGNKAVGSTWAAKTKEKTNAGS